MTSIKIESDGKKNFFQKDEWRRGLLFWEESKCDIYSMEGSSGLPSPLYRKSSAQKDPLWVFLFSR